MFINNMSNFAPIHLFQSHIYSEDLGYVKYDSLLLCLYVSELIALRVTLKWYQQMTKCSISHKMNYFVIFIIVITGKFLSEALILASTKPQYDNRLFIELRVQYMKIPSSEHIVYTNCFFVLTFRTIYIQHVLTLEI